MKALTQFPLVLQHDQNLVMDLSSGSVYGTSQNVLNTVQAMRLRAQQAGTS